jgi:hypothetical protein
VGVAWLVLLVLVWRERELERARANAQSVDVKNATPANSSPQPTPLPTPPKDAFHPGDELLFFASHTPAPLHGLPAPINQSGWLRIDKLMQANDIAGLFKESDGIRFHFLRAQTRVRVIDYPLPIRTGGGEAFAEVRVQSGAAENESVVIPASLLSRGPKPPSDLPDISKLNAQDRHAIFDEYFRTLDTSLETASKDLSPFGKSGVKLSLMTRRLDFEKKAIEQQYDLEEKTRRKFNVNHGEIEAVVWYGLSQGWAFSYRDY